jgi:quinol monooxygenase YgiN
MIALVATMKACKGKEDELLAAMKGLVAEVRAKEEGTLEYVLHRAQEDPATLMVYEKYKDGDALNLHMVTPHFQAAAGKMAELLEGGLTVKSYDVIE